MHREEDGNKVELDLILEGGDFGMAERGRRGEAGVGEKDIERAEAPLHLGKHVLAFGGIGDVRANRESGGAERIGGTAQRLLVAAGDYHFRALVDKKVRGGTADAAVSSGNQRKFSVESAHAGIIPVAVSLKGQRDLSTRVARTG